MSLFEKVSHAASDPIFGPVNAFNLDQRAAKLSFLVGFYHSALGVTPVIKAVELAEEQVVSRKITKEYLPIEGDKEFLEKLGSLIFGGFWERERKRFFAAQALGGTGALRLVGDFCYEELGDRIWISDPTWPNHHGIFRASRLQVESYPYYDYESNKINFTHLMHALEELPEKAIVLLHANCHNPTGKDLSFEQWKELSHLFTQKNLFPVFDMAYQGFGKGIEEDAEGVRLFAEEGHELAVAYSCAKNFSLYGERIGALFILAHSPHFVENLASQIRLLIRTNYSNPPRHGAAVVKEVLASPALKQSWEEELSLMRLRMKEIRAGFSDALQQKIPFLNWDFIRDTNGLFCYTGLNESVIEQLAINYGIYMPSSGRINITMLNRSNLNYVIDAIATLLQQTQ